MSKLWTLLSKDFRRVWRNPWPWVLNLSIPLAITALFGVAFGGGGDDQAGMAKIKVGIVDEDQSLLGSLFRSALSQGEAARYFEVQHPTRSNAMAALLENELSAVFIVPTNFTSEFLTGRTNLILEVIKNPSERVYPTIVEELASVAVTGLNAVHRNFNSEFPRIEAVLTNDFDLVKAGELAKEIGTRFKAAGEYLSPPLVQYRKTVIEKTEDPKTGPGLSVFSFILPGMASAFLLFLADHSMRDIHREKRAQTLDRLRTVDSSVGTFIAGKILCTALTVFLGSLIMFGGGALIFGISWGNYGLLALASAAYSLFAAGLLALLVSWVRTERKSEAMNNMLIFGIAFAGGSFFPANQMPKFFQDHICPWMPNFWFTEAVRSLPEGGDGVIAPLVVVLKLGALGIVLGIIASVILQRRLSAGARA